MRPQLRMFQTAPVAPDAPGTVYFALRSPLDGEPRVEAARIVRWSVLTLNVLVEIQPLAGGETLLVDPHTLDGTREGALRRLARSGR